MFEIPQGYSCVVPAYSSASNSLYAYNSRVRDTYDLIGFNWVRTRHLTTNYDQDLSSYECLTVDKVVPSEVLVHFVLPATLIVLCFFALIIKMFMGVRR